MSRPATIRLTFAALVLAVVTSTGRDERLSAQRINKPVDFSFQVRPLLSDRCFRCHGPDASKRKAKLRLDTREGVFKDIGDGWAIVKPGDPVSSELVRRITTDFEDDLMPPTDSHLSLSETEKALLRRWVLEGAEYKPHWSLIPVHAVAVPKSSTPTATTNPIDVFVRARLEEISLQPAQLAAPPTLLRRLAFNLTGLPPTTAEIAAFTADPSPAAYATAIERYLASPAYGERMALDWLDLARYADTYGYQADVERDMSPYRDWVIRSFNDNLPYDQFLVWQLAGDLLPNATRDQRIATAFNRLHRQTNEGGSVEEEFRTEYVLDRVNTFGTSMLGLTLECARCHDHKFDPITQRDYYSLFAFFNSIDESGLYSHFTNATPSPSLLLWRPETEARHGALTGQVAAAEARLAAIGRGAQPAFNAWLPTASVGRPQPIAHLAFDKIADSETPDSVLKSSAQVQDGLVLVSDVPGLTAASAALRFSGDSPVVHPGARTFVRTDPFSLIVRLQPTEAQDRAVILHQSRAWTDAGSRGYELTLDRGRPYFALVHFWPGNAVAVRATRPLPLNKWSELVVAYDGSSRASGIALYLDGAPLETEVVRDHLYKDINYRREAGDRSSDTHPLTIGARFRDSGFKNGLIDDLRLFDVQLTAAEVAGTLQGGKGDRNAREQFLARAYQPYMSALADLQRLREQENRLIADVPEMMVMEELPSPRPARLLNRGAYDAPGDAVSRATPVSLPAFPASEPRNRLGLARWLTSRGNPLAARVVVNRIWRLHFGRGIVATQEDFGSQGRLPSHPELLDWLAQRFMASGWDVKALHRLILTSDTFRQSSLGTRDAAASDPDNQLLSRGPKRRLTAEEIRDSALAASGLLNRTVGGPSVKPYQPAGFWEQSGTGKVYEQDQGLKLYRRSLYTFWRRTAPPPSMITFDAVTREVCTAKREATATPLQSLVLLNDPQFVEAARALAQKVLQRFPGDERARHREAFTALIGRQPDDTELQILSRLFAEQQGLFARTPDNATRLLAVGASAADPSLPRVEFAATITVVSAIMNLDEFVLVR